MKHQLIAITTICLGVWGAGAASSIPLSKVYVGNNGARTKNSQEMRKATPAQQLQKPAARITQSGGNLFGYCVYSLDDSKGWYEIPMTTDPVHLWTDAVAQNQNTNMKAGWMRNGRLCGISSYEIFGMVLIYNYVELDPTNGKVLLSRPIDIQPSDLSSYFTCATYCPDDDRVYGFGLNNDGRANVFKSCNPEMTEFSLIKVIDDDMRCPSLTWNSDEHKLVGVNNKGTLVEIDVKTGDQTTLMQTNIPDWHQYLTGLVFSPVDDAYLWNVNTYSSGGYEGSYMYSLSPSTGECLQVFTFDNAEEFSYLITPDAPISRTAPSRPKFMAASFKDGSCNGQITFKMPATRRDGTSITSQMSWIAQIDGQTVSEGKSAPATTVNVDFRNVEPGMRVFTLTPVCDGTSGLPGAWTAWIGDDYPATPENVVLDKTEVTWDAVTKGAHNGYIDPAAVSYKVYLNNKLQGTSTSTSYQIEYPENTSVANYKVSIVAVCNGLESMPGFSNSVIWGDALSLPFMIVPTEEQLGLVQYEDTDGDESGWSVNDYAFEEGLCFMSAITMGNANDWLFMPKFTTLEKDAVFAITMDAALVDEGFPDGRLKIALGTSPDSQSMTKVIASDIVLTSASYNTISYLFTIPEEMRDEDTYYIGINASTPDDVIYAVYVRKIEISKTDYESQTPAQPTDVTVEAAPHGELAATVTLFMPRYDVGGNIIPEDEILEAVITGSDTKSVLGKPGEEMSIDVATQQGDNGLAIYVARTVDKKILKSAEQYINVYTGIGVPGIVGSLSGHVTDDNFGVSLEWTAPTEIEKGEWIDFDNLNYALYTNGPSSWYQLENIGKNVYSYTYNMREDTPLQNKYFGIVCSNEAGMSESLRALMFEIGKPLTLPLNEVFEGGVAQLQPLTFATSSQFTRGKWMISDPSIFKDYISNESGIALIGYPGGAGAEGKVTLPKFSTSNIIDANLMLSAWTGEETAEIKVYGETYGLGSPILLGTVEADTEGWNNITFPLPESLLGKKWVSIYLIANYAKSSEFVIIQSYNISGVVGLSQIEASQMNITAYPGGVTISGNGKVSIVTPAGLSVGNFDVDDHISLSLSAGIYFVITEQGTQKIMIP